MKRKVKFRVWDDAHGESKKGFWWSNDMVEFWTWIRNNHISESNIQQFTGLKDKNGKEIYEGDILKLSQKELKYQYLMDKPFPVIFDNYSFGLKVENLNGLYEFLFLSQFDHSKSEIEIVGNIHETPNLLNSSIDNRLR